MSFYQKQREQIRIKILETAITIFKEKGYENASIDEITKSVGIAKGTFYNFYTSKSEILITWAAEKFSGFDMSAAICHEKTLEQNLITFTGILIEAIEDEVQLFQSFLTEIIKVHGNPSYQVQFDFPAIYREIFRHSSDSGIVCKTLPNVKIAVLNSALFMGIIDWFAAGNSVTGLKDYLTDIIFVCMHGLLGKERSAKSC
ncbi:MAG: TetR/AcrR family transcriptional regulator [Bacillota bacterium]|nr:TetR/AcrR family transcriptional regulator [Bacillota bacterium]MDW7683977.1 TetR/AcrR family transcriptional regulator [Bacillota bacterium]